MTAEASAPAQASAPGQVEQLAAGLSAGIRRRRSGSPGGGLAWLVTVASLTFFATAQYCRQLNVDTYFDLYAGRYIAEHGIPERNVLTVLAHGQPWIDQQWLAQLLYYRVWLLGGYAAVVLLSVALVSAGAAFLGALMLRRGASPIRMCGWTLAALAVSYLYATPRAQSFGYLFVPLVLWLVLADDDRAQPRPLTWLSIPLLALWANMHGSVLLGAGFVGLHAATRAIAAARSCDRRGLVAYVALGVAAAASLICTPYGLGVMRYYGSLIGNRELSANVTEWMPPNLANPACWPFFAVVIAVAIAVTIGWRRGARPQADLAIFAVVSLGVAFLAFRNTPWFGFVGCLLATDMLAARSGRPALAAWFRRAFAAVLATCAAVAAVSLALEPVSQYEAWLPRGAIEAAARIASREPDQRVLSDQWSAVGLLWLHPGLLGHVAFDVRVEQYSQPELAEIFSFMLAKGPRWQRLVRGYDLVVVSRRMHPRLAVEMTRMRGWRVVYVDTSGVVVEHVP